MNYRAWNHRCWLISYMTNKQVLYEMKKSRSWAALHVSDNCCFHYRSRLLQKIVEDQNYAEETASYGQNADIVQVVKDKIDWNETLIKRYVGRELRFQRVMQGWPTLFSFQKISLTSLYRSKATSSNTLRLQIYDCEGELSQLAPVDIFVSTVDALKEPPLVTANTVLSILAVDYPVDKVSCYVSDDGSAMLTFEALSYSRVCKVDKIQPSFVKERRAMKREYEEFKVRINSYVAKAQKTPEEGWTMQDGIPWPGNNSRESYWNDLGVFRS
ncbi:unnamed protein product [Trifolium pratense]|uniref:Uncharacterized protein n=1 Tax=Trifolium pratense TaxID=57577 RepID=A0ACB0JJR6_TRIPR|nr:unnamed protein product [Trifolium pratense]